MIFLHIRRSRLAYGLLDIRSRIFEQLYDIREYSKSESCKYFEGFGLTSSSSSACSGFVVDLWMGFLRGREE